MKLEEVVPSLLDAIAHLPEVEVGYPADVVGDEWAGIVAATELGDDDRDPRPFLEAGEAEAQHDVDRAGAQLADALGGTGDGSADVAAATAALEAVGAAVAEGVRRVLDQGTELAPLRPSTVAAKGGERRPLVDPEGADRFRTLLTVRLRPRPRSP